jgi:hypothetical protein
MLYLINIREAVRKNMGRTLCVMSCMNVERKTMIFRVLTSGVERYRPCYNPRDRNTLTMGTAYEQCKSE